jgi:hypothetical protein
MGRFMALWKVEHGTTRKFVVDDPMRLLDLVALLALAASPGLLLVSLIPLPLVLPALSILSFVIACGVALFAHFSKVSRHEHSITSWEISYAFAFVWVAAGMMSNPQALMDWFERLPTMP